MSSKENTAEEPKTGNRPISKMDLKKWDDFGYILKVKTKRQDRSRVIREFIDAYLEENKDILANRL